jgi:ACS family hexuronate transporter-like MFS transporter
VFALCKVLSDATWWVLLYWLPDILHTHLGLSLRGVGVASGGVYLGAGLGAFAGGLLPNLFQTVLRSPEHARRLVMGGAALCVVPMLFVYDSHTVFFSMGVFALALMAHQVFATNLFALMTEWAPGFLVGRIMGIGAFCGNLGGAGLLWLTGRVPMPFVLGLCSLSYLVAWGVLWVWASPDWLERVVGAPGQGGGAQTGLSRQEWNAARAPVDDMVPVVVHGH